MPSGKHTGKGKKCPPGCTCGRHKRHQRPETKEKISKALIKLYKERGLLPDPDKKRCNRCHQYKRLPEDYYPKSVTKLKSGAERRYYDTFCKTCRKEYNREKLRQKNPEELRAMWRTYRENWIKKHGEAEIRRKERERKAVWRDKNGLPPSSRPRISEDDIRVDRKPIMDFVEGEIERLGMTKAEVAVKAGIDGSRLDRLLAGYEVVKRKNANPKYKSKLKWRKDGTRRMKITQVHLGVVDQLLTALDAEYMLTILYPE